MSRKMESGMASTLKTEETEDPTCLVCAKQGGNSVSRNQKVMKRIIFRFFYEESNLKGTCRESYFLATIIFWALARAFW